MSRSAREFRIDINLVVAEFTQAVDVTAERPLIDVRQNAAIYTAGSGAHPTAARRRAELSRRADYGRRRSGRQEWTLHRRIHRAREQLRRQRRHDRTTSSRGRAHSRCGSISSRRSRSSPAATAPSTAPRWAAWSTSSRRAAATGSDGSVGTTSWTRTSGGTARTGWRHASTPSTISTPEIFVNQTTGQNPVARLRVVRRRRRPDSEAAPVVLCFRHIDVSTERTDRPVRARAAGRPQEAHELRIERPFRPDGDRGDHAGCARA